MPSEINEIFEKIKEDVQWLHIHWAYYKELFHGPELRIDLMNESAPLFFYINQTLLLDEVILSICKLTDPAKSSRDTENMSLNKLNSRFDGISSKNDPFKKHRHKRIAHKDLAITMSTESILPDISIQMIEDLLNEISNFMNTIEVYFNNTETGYKDINISTDSGGLIGLLKYGFQYEELMKSDKISYEDLEQSKYYNS